MIDNLKHEVRRRETHLGGTASPPVDELDAKVGEASCGAFGYLRGIREQSASVEFRFRDGTSAWFPYSWLGSWKFDPSQGLLLKFCGDVVSLVLIRGSNLDRPLNDGAINLTHAGLQRHRVLWIREMSADEIGQVGESGPTIDSIETADFESHADLLDGLSENAPGFLP